MSRNRKPRKAVAAKVVPVVYEVVTARKVTKVEADNSFYRRKNQAGRSIAARDAARAAFVAQLGKAAA